MRSALKTFQKYLESSASSGVILAKCFGSVPCASHNMRYSSSEYAPIMQTFIRQDYNKSFDRPSSAGRPMPLGEFRKYGGDEFLQRVMLAHICGVGRIERQGAQMRVGAINGESATDSLEHHLVQRPGLAPVDKQGGPLILVAQLHLRKRAQEIHADAARTRECLKVRSLRTFARYPQVLARTRRGGNSGIVPLRARQPPDREPMLATLHQRVRQKKVRIDTLPNEAHFFAVRTEACRRRSEHH